MKRAAVFGLVLLSALPFIGCRSRQPVETDYEAALPPGQLALRKITDPAQIPDFTQACRFNYGLKESAQNSLNYLSKPSSKKHFPYGTITHDQAVASLNAFVALLNDGKSPAEMNWMIREKFDVYISVGCDNKGTVLFTGYYTPIFDASEQETAKFKCPLYKKPADLVKLPDGNPSTPMPDRRTIETSEMYKGNELVWMADPFQAYVAHIQGSARLRMPDGREMTVGYAANNGHEYKSIRAELVRDGKIVKRAGLPDMLDYFRRYPGQVKQYTWRNPRYVFFDIISDGRPRGCLNEPVTTMRSIATDKKIFPPASLTFISTTLPQRVGGKVMETPYVGFALDQDAGGAIRAAGRCDVYMGIGAEAGQLAGRAQNEGKLYYLFLKPSSVAVSAPAAKGGTAEPAAGMEPK